MFTNCCDNSTHENEHMNDQLLNILRSMLSACMCDPTIANAGIRVLAMMPDNKLLEIDSTRTKLVKLNCKLVEIDYKALVEEKIEELCSAIGYESNAGKPYKTESTMYDKIIGNKVTDLIDTDNVDISSVKIKSVIDFLINVDPKFIETLKSMMGNVAEIDPDLDLASILAYGIKIILKEDTAEVVAIKKVLLVTSILMAYIEKRKLELEIEKRKKAAAAEKEK